MGAAGYEKWAAEVRALARERDAVILAHNYQDAAIQDVADYVGDSLELSRLAAKAEASTIVFCGVHFMAETAKILSPDKTVLLPSLEAGCSLADTVEAADVERWRLQNPDGLVVSYVNTSAAVKALSDVCCTSANAVDVVESLPEGKKILFLPDFFLGSHVARETGRDIEVWMGECHVHAKITPEALRKKVAEDPTAEVFVHPECGCSTTALDLWSAGDLPKERTRLLSTGAMIRRAREIGPGRALVATEVGILHQLRAANPEATFEAVDGSAVCPFMKMTTQESLIEALRNGIYEIEVEQETAKAARRALEAMIAIGPKSIAVPSGAA